MKRLRLRPLAAALAEPRTLAESPPHSGPLPPPSGAPGEREMALEREVAFAQARLEELGHSTAEYQAINEELQSANEALLASREELQSVNHELQAINGELAERLTELARVHGDTANLLASTRVAVLFLDAERRVRHFTPRMAELFALVDADLDRPAASLGARLPYAEMEQDAIVVLDDLTRAHRQTRTPGGHDCAVRVLPHHSVDGFLAGVVLIFLE